MAENTTGTSSGAHRAGLFDIRFIIAALLGLYGIIILIAGLLVSDSQLAKSDGLNVNIVGGIGMLVTAALFATWARLRPIVVPEHVEKEDTPG